MSDRPKYCSYQWNVQRHLALQGGYVQLGYYHYLRTLEIVLKNMEIQGKIVQILPLQSGVGKASGKEWKKQEYILETLDVQFPKKICFNLWGDNVDKFALQVGEEVTVQIDLESREFSGRWYTDVRAWRIDRGLVSLANPMAPGAAPAQPGYVAPTQPAFDPLAGAPTVQTPPPASAGMGADDLPF